MSASLAKVSPNKEDISLLASQLWENAGRPVGRDLEFWLQAEGKLLAATVEPTKVPAPTPAPVAAASTPKITSPTPSQTSFLKFGKKKSK